MINETQARRYCCDDICKIENYAEAVSDSKMWDLHHRAETDEVLSKRELKAQDRYWKRPASELVFLTKSAHMQLHFDAGTMENQRKAARKAWAETGRKNGAANGRKGAQKQSKPVLQFTKDGTFVKEWLSIREIKRQLGFHAGHICDCCNGRLKSAHGFVWRCKA